MGRIQGEVDETIATDRNNMNNKQETRGGVRIAGPGKKMGAPKKPEAEKKVILHIRIRPDLAGWLRTQPGTKTAVVEDALDRLRASTP